MPQMAPLSARSRVLLRPTAPRHGGTSLIAAYGLACGALALLAILATGARGRNPVRLPLGESWLAIGDAFDGAVGHGLSLVGGCVLAIVTIKATGPLVHHCPWARALHEELRPAVRSASDRTIVVLGLTSALGEELFCRGMLTTAVGLFASSLVFGLLHQMRGRAGWVWTAWAMLMGLLFGVLFLATGSVVGPVVAHAAINVANLRFLRDTEVDPPKRPDLGGLLRRG